MKWTIGLGLGLAVSCCALSGTYGAGPADVTPPPSVCSIDLSAMAAAQQQESFNMTASNAAPTVEVPEMLHDFGVIEENGNYIHEFRARNTGSGILEIKKVIPS
ncbi:MAG: hypothetical protein ACLGPL_02635 [Acidobacteriota bacterium]